MKSATKAKGAPVTQRTGGLGKVSALIGKSARDQFFDLKEPINIVRRKQKKDKERLKKLEARVKEEIGIVVSNVLD